MHRRAKGADARRQGFKKAEIGTVQRRVAQGAAAERIEGRQPIGVSGISCKGHNDEG